MIPEEDLHLSDSELLSEADGELPRRRRRQVRAHLEACWTCRTRMAQLERSIASFTKHYQSSFVQPESPNDAFAAARLRVRLAEVKESSPQMLFTWKSLTLAAALACILFLTITTVAQRRASINNAHARETEITPDPNLTPGETTFVSRSQVCQSKSKTEQVVPDNLKTAVLAEYGIKNAPQNLYEVDFLITPELGGAASIRNLWPQPYFASTWNARVKDTLENRLHQLVCNGDLDLSTAQREIATNWVDAYKKYVGSSSPM